MLQFLTTWWSDTIFGVAEVSSNPSWVWVPAKQNDSSCRSCMQSELKTNWILIEKVSLAWSWVSQGVRPKCCLLSVFLDGNRTSELSGAVFSSSFSRFSHDLLLAVMLVISSCFTVCIFFKVSCIYLFWPRPSFSSAGFSLLVVSRAHCPVVVHRLPIMLAALGVERRLEGAVDFCSYSSLAPGHRGSAIVAHRAPAAPACGIFRDQR